MGKAFVVPTLIDLLNEHSSQTPDQIVTALQNQKLGWVKLTEITQAQHDRMFMRHCVLTSAERAGQPWIVQGPRANWEFWFDMDDCRDWPHSYVKLVEEYTDGEPLPD